MFRHRKVWTVDSDERSDNGNITEYCPYCQMPLMLIKRQNVSLHLEVCIRQRSKQKSVKECPKGLKCESTMICHYERFCHEILADARANNNVENSQQSSLSNVSITSVKVDIENSSEDFVSDSNLASVKRKKLHRNCKQSPMSDKTTLQTLRKKSRRNNIKKQSCSDSVVIVSEQDNSSFIPPSNTSSKNLNSSTSRNVSSSLDSKKSEKNFWSRNSENVDNQNEHIRVSESEAEETIEICDNVETGFKKSSYDSTSTEACFVKEDKSTVDPLSSLNGGSKMFKSPFGNTGSPKKQKQTDIGTLLFGLKPLQPKVIPVLKATEEKPTKNFGFPKKKSCPFYKKVDGTDIAVDAFSYGLIPGINYYFLSHFHYDHYMGLSKKFGEDIYCSGITGNLLEARLNIQKRQVKRLPLNEKVEVGNVFVTLLEANHCPGAVLFLFQLKNKRIILHTGDFRADRQLLTNQHIQGSRIDTLYLDTTYLDPTYSFPPQNDVIQYVATTVERLVKENPLTLVVTGTYCIGKEKIFLGIATRLNIKIFVSRDKERVLKCLGDKEVNQRITTDSSLTNLHVLPMNKLNPSNLNDYLKKFEGVYDRLVAVKPTGWTFKGASTNLNELKPSVYARVMIYGVPYSEHSSFTELKKFVELLKPNRIIPTVNVGKPESRKMMESYLNVWKK